MMNGTERFNWGRTITYGGAFIAFLIGSGFATGQEVIQYFSGYGYVGIILIGFMVVKTLRGNLLSRAEKAAASA